MKNALILPGRADISQGRNPEGTLPHTQNWPEWLAKQLNGEGLYADVLALPDPHYPVYCKWKEVIEQYRIGAETTIVTHGVGAAAILRIMSEDAKMEAGQLIMVGPWHINTDRIGGEFMRYDLDRDLRDRVGGRLTIVASVDAGPNFQASANFLHYSLHNSEIYRWQGFGNFVLGNSMESEEFPELVEIIVP